RAASIPAGTRTRIRTFGGSDAVRYTTRICGQTKHPGPDSNRDRSFRKAACCPLHHQDKEPTTGFAPVWAGLRDRCLIFSATSARSRSARIRTLCRGVGGRLLSQEHAPVIVVVSLRETVPPLAGRAGNIRSRGAWGDL